MREATAASILENKIIVIVRGVPEDKLIPMAEAMYEGGIRLLEITFDARGKISDEETGRMISSLVRHFDGRMRFGAGTVLKPEQVDITKAAGGSFIISPDANPEVIRHTRKCGLISMPGAMTPTEVQAAHLAGADFVKLFPVSSLGPAYVKAILAPLSHIKVMAVGGVDEKNMADYLSAGASGFGIGSTIVNKKMIAEGDYAAITARAKLYVDTLHAAL